MEVIDDYFSGDVFSELQGRMLSQDICWHFVPFTDGDSKNNDQFFFGHNIYINHSWVSGLSKVCEPLITRINPMAIHMIRANLMTKSDRHIESELHSDLDINAPTRDRIDQWTTAVFYINDCNGYTKFEDNRQVESKANRLVAFPSNVRHLGATCTDEKRRVLINLNYIT